MTSEAKPWPPPGRIPCVVIGCRRTASQEWAGDDSEIICGPHYRSVPAWLRRRYARIRKLARRAEARQDEAMWYRVKAVEVRLWARLRGRAIEIAMGITA